MAWTYDETNLATSTASGRLNVVRLLVGDTQESDQQIQDEEITFGLSENGDDVYFTASWVATLIASKYSRRVDTELDGVLKANYSNLASSYRVLSSTLRAQGQRNSGNGLAVYGGGLTKTSVDTLRADKNLVRPSFERDQFRFENTEYGKLSYIE